MSQRNRSLLTKLWCDPLSIARIKAKSVHPIAAIHDLDVHVFKLSVSTPFCNIVDPFCYCLAISSGPGAS